MTTARSISRVDSTVETGIVNKVETDGVVYRDAEKCYVLDMVHSYSYLDLLNPHILWQSSVSSSPAMHQELTSNGKALTKKIEHELVKDVIKYGKEEVFRKMMDRFVSCFRKVCSFQLLSQVSLFSNVRVFPRPYTFFISVWHILLHPQP